MLLLYFFGGGYVVIFHASIEGCQSGPDPTWFEIKSLFLGLVILVWTVDLADFKIRTCGIFFALSFFFSCINIVDSSFYRMYVLIQFVLLCQTLSGLRTGCVYDRMIAAAKRICLKGR